MGYQWERGEGIADGFRRIAEEELSAAVKSLTEPEARGVEASVHDARKRCKKVRGLARVVRPGLDKATYQEINGGARTAARELSPFRDAHALLATFDHLLTTVEGPLPSGGLFAVRAELSRRSQEASAAVASRGDAVEAAVTDLETLRTVVAECDVEDDPEVVVRGVTRTYRRGRQAIDQAWRTLDDEDLHEWRKREKDLWYATRLLTPWAPAVLDTAADLLHTLSEDLGDDHDLAVLTELVTGDPEAFGGPSAIAATASVVDDARARLQEHAFGLGAQVYAEVPGAFGRRLRTYWRTWHHLDRDLPRGGG